MNHLTDDLDAIANKIRADFEARDAARERALPLCREAIRHCGNAIRALHRGELDSTRNMLGKAGQLIAEARQSIAACSELHNIGFLRDAQKEFAEGSIILAIVSGERLPGPDELDIDYAPYLNGLGEAVGEIRRYLLDRLRQGNQERAEEFLRAMDDIYNILVTMDFPNAITGGLRRTTDMVRGVLERTRSDLTLTMQQKRLEDRLERLKQ